MGVTYLHNLVKSLKNDRDQLTLRRRLLNTVNEDERPMKTRRNIKDLLKSGPRGANGSVILSFENHNL